jgi:hypothetical protein
MFAYFPAVWRIQFQRTTAALGILVLVDFAAPTAHTDGQVLISMWNVSGQASLEKKMQSRLLAD